MRQHILSTLRRGLRRTDLLPALVWASCCFAMRVNVENAAVTNDRINFCPPTSTATAWSTPQTWPSGAAILGRAMKATPMATATRTALIS